MWEASRPAPPSSGRRRRPPPAAHVAYEYEALWLWNMPRPEYGIWRRGPRPRANGRSLIYETGAAPPPCHNRVPGARARCRRPPPRAQSRFRWRVVRPASPRVRVRSALRTSEARGRETAATPAMRRWPTMPRVKPACVRRVSIGTCRCRTYHTTHTPTWNSDTVIR